MIAQLGEKIFETDVLSKRERVERTLRHEPVDRVALLEQLSYNPGVISLYTGRDMSGFQYTVEDICAVIRKTMDMCFPPKAPRGTKRYTTDDGFVLQDDHWMTWHVSRPFSDLHGAKKWLLERTEKIGNAPFDPDMERETYRNETLDLQSMVGDTVILNYSWTGFCDVFDSMGLEIFVYFYEDYPRVFSDYLAVCVERELRRINAVADRELSPVILIPEDFATKQGPIFPPQFLRREHYPHVKRLTDAWHEHGVTVLYHSDGNYRKSIEDLVGCGIKGFYCLEPSVGMDIVELKNMWPELVWAGGVDGVDLLERGRPQEVRAEVRRHIVETNALRTGGMFVASSSDINPPIQPANFKAMVDAVGEMRNPDG